MRPERPRIVRALAGLGLALCLTTAAADDDGGVVDGFFGAPAAPPTVRWGGVAEWRGTGLAMPGSPNGTGNQALLRLTFDRALAGRRHVTAHVEGRMLQASDPQMLQRLKSPSLASDRALALAATRTGPESLSALDVDWLYLQGAWAGGRYTLGRQPVNPSIGRLWSPVDLYAPFRPDDLERLYKPGVDAAQATLDLGDALTLTTLVAAGRDGPGRVHLNLQQRAGLEAPWGRAFVLAGTRREQSVAGLGLQVNDLGGQDVYSELLWHAGPQADPGLPGRHAGLRALLGLSRKLGRDTLGTLEVFHQSRGTDNPALYDAYTARAASIDLPFLGVGRRYAGLAISSRLQPLLGLNLLLLANLGDHSSALTAELDDTPLPNLELRTTLSLPTSGRAASEYRRAGRAAQLTAQWFF